MLLDSLEQFIRDLRRQGTCGVGEFQRHFLGIGEQVALLIDCDGVNLLG